MNRKYIILILLAIISLGLAAWYWYKYIRPKSAQQAEYPENDQPNPNNEFVDVRTDDEGKKAYSKFGNAVLYTLNFNTIKTIPENELVGTITGMKNLRTSDEYFYVIDEKYLVSQLLVRVE